MFVILNNKTERERPESVTFVPIRWVISKTPIAKDIKKNVICFGFFGAFKNTQRPSPTVIRKDTPKAIFETIRANIQLFSFHNF